MKEIAKTNFQSLLLIYQRYQIFLEPTVSFRVTTLVSKLLVK